jgi:hypothetical protein
MYGIMRLLVLIEFINQFTIHGMNNVKVINAPQAIIIHHNENTKEKSLKTDAAVWFNLLEPEFYI